MADNVDITEGSGKTVATDDVQVDGSHSQGQVQFMKLVDGTLNGTGSVRVNQAAKANALTVAPASDISDATYIGDIKFGESIIAGTNLIGKVGIDQTTPGTTNRVDIGALIPGTGATNLGKARDSALGATDTGVMVLAVRDDTLTTLTPADGDYVPLRTTSVGALHVTVSNITACNTGAVVLATGSAAIGKLAANTGVDIGDVDVTSIVPGVAATNLGKAEDAGHSSGDVGVAAMTVRANTATSLSGSDNDYQPLITDTNGRLHVLDANSTTIVSDTTAIKSAVEIMDDWDAVHDSAASSDGPQVMAAYDSTKPAVVEDGDAVRMLADQYGRLLAGVEPQHFQAVFDSANASAEGNAVHASAASTIIVVQSYIISSDAEIWVKLQEEDSTALTGKFWLKAGGGVAITLPDKAPIVLGVDSDLEVITEGAGNVSVSVTGYTIPG